jgi:hypothetical protein
MLQQKPGAPSPASDTGYMGVMDQSGRGSFFTENEGLYAQTEGFPAPAAAGSPHHGTTPGTYSILNPLTRLDSIHGTPRPAPATGSYFDIAGRPPAPGTYYETGQAYEMASRAPAPDPPAPQPTEGSYVDVAGSSSYQQITLNGVAAGPGLYLDVAPKPPAASMSAAPAPAPAPVSAPAPANRAPQSAPSQPGDEYIDVTKAVPLPRKPMPDTYTDISHADPTDERARRASAVRRSSVRTGNTSDPYFDVDTLPVTG